MRRGDHQMRRFGDRCRRLLRMRPPEEEGAGPGRGQLGQHLCGKPVPTPARMRPRIPRHHRKGGVQEQHPLPLPPEQSPVRRAGSAILGDFAKDIDQRAGQGRALCHRKGTADGVAGRRIGVLSQNDHPHIAGAERVQRGKDLRRSGKPAGGILQPVPETRPILPKERQMRPGGGDGNLSCHLGWAFSRGSRGLDHRRGGRQGDLWTQEPGATIGCQRRTRKADANRCWQRRRGQHIRQNIGGKVLGQSPPVTLVRAWQQRAAPSAAFCPRSVPPQATGAAAFSRSSLALAAPESMLSRAIATPSFRSPALPATTSAPALFSSTASR